MKKFVDVKFAGLFDKSWFSNFKIWKMFVYIENQIFLDLSARAGRSADEGLLSENWEVFLLSPLSSVAQ